MLVASREDEHVTPRELVPKQLDHDVGRGAKSEQADGLAVADFGQANRPIADHAGA